MGRASDKNYITGWACAVGASQGVVKYREATRHTFHDPRIAALDPRNLKRD